MNHEGAYLEAERRNAVLRQALDETLQNLAEERQLREKLAGILTATANALKGPPPPLTLWDWSDLPEVAAGVRAAAKAAADRILGQYWCEPPDEVCVLHRAEAAEKLLKLAVKGCLDPGGQEAFKKFVVALAEWRDECTDS